MHKGFEEAYPGRRRGSSVLAALALFVVLTLTACSAATVDQTPVIDEANIFGDDIGKVEDAVTALQQKGADVRVRTIDNYSGYANLDLYEAQLEQNSPSWLGTNGNIKNNLVVIIVSLEERQSGIYYGELWNDRLDSKWNSIQTEKMHPLFEQNDYAGGVAAGLNAIGSAISGQGQTTSMDWTMPLAIVAIVAVLAAAVAIYWFRRQRARRSAWRQRAMLAKQAAASGINELLEKVQMLEIKVNVTAEKVTTLEAAPMREGLEKATALVNRSSQAYSELAHSAGDPENPELDVMALEHIEKEYIKIAGDLREAQDHVADVEKRIAEAQRSMEEHSAKVAQVTSAIAAAEEMERRLQGQGYRTRHVSELLAVAREALDRAQSSRSSKDYAAGLVAANEAGDGVERALKALDELPHMKEKYEGAVPALEARIEQTKSAVVEGRSVFDDLSQEYAESTWTSVKGNGTEAENRINWAGDALQESQNAAAASDWYRAVEMVEKGNGLLTEAASFMRSIHQLQKDLLAARRDASPEISAASGDIAKAWEYIGMHDEDVRESLEDDLREAEKRNELAKRELTLSRPDYFKVCELARQANTMADRVLVQARNEHDEAERQRVKVTSTRRDASAQVSIAREYIEDHVPVVKDEAKRSLKSAESSLREAERAQDLEATLSLLTMAEADGRKAYTQAQRDVDSSWERPRRTEDNVPDLMWPPILFPGPGRAPTGPQPWGTRRDPGPGIPSGRTSSGWGASGGSPTRGGSASWGSSHSPSRGRRGGGSSGW